MLILWICFKTVKSLCIDFYFLFNLQDNNLGNQNLTKMFVWMITSECLKIELLKRWQNNLKMEI